MSSRVVHQTEGMDAASYRQSLKSKSPSGLFRKLTTKLRPPSLYPKSTRSVITSPSTSPTQSSVRRSVVPTAPADVAAVKRRRAALQQCGLVPLQRRDLSQMEEELDRRFSHLAVPPQDQPEQGEMTTAEKIRREWQTKNETLSEKQGHDLDQMLPNASDSLVLGKSDFTTNPQALALTVPPSSHSLLSPTDPISPYAIPSTFLFPDIPEEAPTEREAEKALPSVPSVGTLGSLPDSPSPSSPRENKRPPPIVVNLTANHAKENAEDVNRGRMLNRQSAHSLMTKSSLPALSPTMTASSSSSLPTPRDEESRERMEATIAGSMSGKSRPSRFGKVSDSGRDSEELDVVHETIPESPEPTPTEPKAQNQNRESVTTMGSAGFNAFVEKRERWKMSAGVFSSGKRGPGSGSRKPAGSELGLGWSDIANDLSLKPLDGGNSRSSTLLSTPTSTDEHGGLTPTQSQTAIEQPQLKVTRSRSVITSLGLKMSRKATPQPSMLARHSPSPSPVRLPTIRIVENRENLLQDVKGIEDDESRRLSELAFVDF